LIGLVWLSSIDGFTYSICLANTSKYLLVKPVFAKIEQ
jgi:hypothetical protein